MDKEELISSKVKGLLKRGNIQEQRNKEFALKYATNLVLVLAVGFLAGFMAHKSIADPISDLAKITIEKNLQTTVKPH